MNTQENPRINWLDRQKIKRSMDLLTPRSPNCELPLHTQRQCTTNRSSWDLPDHYMILDTLGLEGRQACLSSAAWHRYRQVVEKP